MYIVLIKNYEDEEFEEDFEGTIKGCMNYIYNLIREDVLFTNDFEFEIVNKNDEIILSGSTN